MIRSNKSFLYDVVAGTMTAIFISARTMIFPYNFLIVPSKYGGFIVDVDVSEVFFLGYSQ